MSKLYYHPALAWNLIDCAIREGLMKDPVEQYGSAADSYWARERARAQSWVNRENLRVALEMFPFADQVLLPGLDVHNGGALWSEGHVDWAITGPRKDAIWLLKEMADFKPFILKGPEYSKVASPERTFDEAVKSFARAARR